MGLRIATNVQSLSAQRSLGITKQAQGESLQKLSSGQRINKAADDAAGLAISEKLKAQIRGIRQATRNANDGVSLIQTAEGGMNEIGNVLIRLRELSVQSASDTIGNSERQFTNLEFQNLKQEIQRIAEVTKFNGKALLNGKGNNGEKMDIQVGIQNGEFQDRISYRPADSDLTLEALEIAELGVGDKVSAQENLSKLDESIRKVNGSRAQLGALQNRLQSTVNNLKVTDENLSAANSRIRDVDVAEEAAELTKNNILSSAGTTVLLQANTNTQTALKLLQ